MDDGFDCWVDERGRVITQSGQGVTETVSRDPVLEAGYVHLEWNEEGVTLRYSAERIEEGALRGAIRQIRLIKRPVHVHRHKNGDWQVRLADSGQSAIGLLRAEDWEDG